MSIKSEKWFAPMIEIRRYVNEDQWRTLFTSTVRDQLGIDVDIAVQNGCCSWSYFDELIEWIDVLLEIPDNDQDAIDRHYAEPPEYRVIANGVECDEVYDTESAAEIYAAIMRSFGKLVEIVRY